MMFGDGISSYILITALSSALVARSVEAYKTLSLGWAFDEFKAVLEEN